MFKVGDKVSGMYDSGRSGTVLDDSGEVVKVEPKEDGRAWVRVLFATGRAERYLVSKSGKSDYLQKN